MDRPLQHRDLAVERGDQTAQRLDADAVTVRQLDLVEPTGTGHAPQVLHRRMQACLASTAFTCAFKPVRMHTNFAR